MHPVPWSTLSATLNQRFKLNSVDFTRLKVGRPLQIEAKSKCDWKEDSDAPHNMSVRAAAWSNSSSYEHALSVSPPDTSQANELTQKLQLHTCRVDVADATHWQVMRLGPFVTNGGWDWIETNIDNALYSESRDAFVTAALMAPVFANGTLIDILPLHVHHMHLTQTYQSYAQAASKNGATSLFYQATPPFIVDEYTFHMHGDSPCTEDDDCVLSYATAERVWNQVPDRGFDVFQR